MSIWRSWSIRTTPASNFCALFHLDDYDKMLAVILPSCITQTSLMNWQDSTDSTETTEPATSPEKDGLETVVIVIMGIIAIFLFGAIFTIGNFIYAKMKKRSTRQSSAGTHQGQGVTANEKATPINNEERPDPYNPEYPGYGAVVRPPSAPLEADADARPPPAFGTVAFGLDRSN